MAERELDAQFEADYRLKFNFAPPLARRPNSTGETRKIELGGWMWMLSPVNCECAVEIAKLPDMVRGHGETKRACVERYRARLPELASHLRTGKLAGP